LVPGAQAPTMATVSRGGIHSREQRVVRLNHIGRVRLHRLLRGALGLWLLAQAALLGAGASAALAADAAAGAAPGAPGSTAPVVHGVVIDPADYLAQEPNAAALADKLTKKLAENGVNLIYLNTYNVEYGAYYRTSYLYNRESDYGKQDFLGKLIASASQRGIRVAAALYDHQHRGAWEANPAWRAKTQSGGDYNPPRTDVQYYLSTGNPAVIAWWRGFLADILTSYPNLEGFELREPIVNWWGTSADHNPAVERAFRAAHPGAPVGGPVWRAYRQQVLTAFLKGEIAQIHAARRFVHVTTVADTGADGHLMSAQDEARETGFDLDALVSGRDRPDAVKVELIWQQWARNYDYIVFTPEWTGRALTEFARQVRGRVPVIAHVELTDFGSHVQSAEEFYRTLASVARPGVGIDFYSAFLAEGKHAWPAIRSVFTAQGAPARPAGLSRDARALILYDGTGAKAALSRLRAVELANLIGHFDVRWELLPVEEYARGDLSGYAYAFYSSTEYGNATPAFLSDAAVFDGTMVWIGQNLFQLQHEGRILPFAQRSQVPRSDFTSLTYGTAVLPAKGEAILTQPGASTVLATLRGPAGAAPFIMRAGKFTYVAGSPFSNLDQTNGRYLAFADSLQEVFGQHPAAAHRAFIRIEDVDPLTRPADLRALADVFASRKTPFMVGVIPFFVDPATKQDVALRDRPDLVRALKYAVSKGGAIVLHGSSHQYQGKTGLDYEFWNPATLTGVAVDGESYVRTKVDSGLAEMWATGLHPIAWETPHYSATAYDYTAFGEYFSTFVERRTYGVWDGSAYQQTFPYAIQRDVFGARILPENIGFVREPGDIGRMVDGARALLSVRDSVAGGFIHRNVAPALVRSLIDQIYGLGYTFVDLYTLPNTVTTPARVELTGFGWATVAIPSHQYLQERFLSRAGTVTRSIATPFAEYARITRSWADVPGNGIYSMRAVLHPQSGDATAGLGSGSGRIATVGSAMLFVTLALAALGVLALAGAYAGVRVRGAP
jgi:uncharacterized protein YdaL